jgi:crossover junction endodeoxyribonuclease RuvC
MASATQNPTRVIGIDPGLNVTGYGVVEGDGSEAKLVEAGVIRLPASRGENLAARLEALFNELRQVMNEFHPQAMCLEEVYSHADYPRTAILMGHARGVICLAARLAGIPVLSFSAKRVKQSVTGNGNASKLQVQRAVQHFFSLDRTPHPPDVADALAVALCYMNGVQFRHSGHGERRRSKVEKPDRE